jgi:hypothetical protein
MQKIVLFSELNAVPDVIAAVAVTARRVVMKPPVKIKGAGRTPLDDLDRNRS